MAGVGGPVVRRTDHKPSTTVRRMLQKLERVRAAIANVDQLPFGWQTCGAFQPQATLAVLTLAPLGLRFPFSDFRPTVQNLIRQADHFTRDRINGQAVWQR